jgi:hypothetical protein
LVRHQGQRSNVVDVDVVILKIFAENRGLKRQFRLKICCYSVPQKLNGTSIFDKLAKNDFFPPIIDQNRGKTVAPGNACMLQGCQIFRGTTNQNREKSIKLPQITPVGYIIYQVAVKYVHRPNGHKLHQHLLLQDRPKFTQVGILVLK